MKSEITKYLRIASINGYNIILNSCLSIIDDQNMLSFLKFGNDNRNAMSISENIQKKDVWSFLWAKVKKFLVSGSVLIKHKNIFSEM